METHGGQWTATTRVAEPERTLNMCGKSTENYRGFMSGSKPEFVLEPLVRVKDAKVMGYELLFRGTSLDRERFFTRIDEVLDFEIFKRAIEYIKVLQERGETPAPSRFFVNIKPGTLIAYSEQIKQLLEEALCPVVLELREDFVDEHLVEELRKLKDDYLISLDDFGKASSNLDRLLYLSPKFVKLDLQILKGLPQQMSILFMESIKKFKNLTLILEKVESKEDLAFAKIYGVELAQGWLWSGK